MDYDYSKRGYLLPPGCKDLADLLKPKVAVSLKPKATTSSASEITAPPADQLIEGQISVRDLAAVLELKPFQVIADLMGLGVFATVNQEISRDLATQVARKHGYDL